MRWTKRILLFLVLPLLVLAAAAVGGAAWMRAQVVADNADARKIVQPNGIDERRVATIGGIKQYISIRGQDRRNPVMLFLHGGPGSAVTAETYAIQRPWEDFFTVVMWDQRGAGQTYVINDKDAVRPTMTIPRMVADADEMIDYLRRDLHQSKVVLVGHSWGTIPGLTIARQHPEKLYAYVGIGQVANMVQSEALGYRYALDRARQAGDTQAVRELRSIAPYPQKNGNVTIDQIVKQRTWLTKYDGSWYGRDDNGPFDNAVKWTPDFGVRDLYRSSDAAFFTLDRLLAPLMAVDLPRTLGTKFDVPIILMMGDNDYQTNHQLARAYFDRMQAPKKEYVEFSHAAHFPYVELPGRFVAALADKVVPLTQASTAGGAK